MSESNMWRNMRKRMHPYWDEATRHEDKFNTGIADVSFVAAVEHGWIELKQMDLWPKRASTIVRCRHFTAQQRNFLKAKGRAGGNTWLFAKIGHEYMLFHWTTARFFGEVNAKDLHDLAFGWWCHKMNWQELGDILSQGHS